MTSKVAIIVPVCNEGQYLRATLQSVIAQTYSDFALFVSCNHCTDDSQAIADGFAAADPRVHVLTTGSLLASIDHWTWILQQIHNREEFCYGLSIGAHDVIAINYVDVLISRMRANPSIAICYSADAYATDSYGRIKFKYPPMPQTFKANDFFQTIPIILSLRYNILGFGLMKAHLFFSEEIYKCYAVDHIRIGLFSISGIITSAEGTSICVRDTSQGLSQYAAKHFGTSSYDPVMNLATQLGWVDRIAERAKPTNHQVIDDAARSASLVLYIVRYLEQFQDKEALQDLFNDPRISAVFQTQSCLLRELEAFVKASIKQY